LLIYGELPKKPQLEEFANKLKNHSLINEKMLRIMEDFPAEAHPMVMLASSVCALNAFYPDVAGANQTEEQVNLHIIRLIAKLPTLITWNYKLSKKQAVNYPRLHLDYCSNFLSMMFSDAKSEYEVDPVVAKALDILLILHADHEQNCSTSTVRLVGSSKASLYASISAGICALWGPLHGGANQEVIEMLDKIKADGGNVKKWVEIAKDKNSGFRLSGFGHRVYKNFDPRARIIKKACDDVLNKLGINDPTLDIAKQLEQAALEDDYFKERKLYPNVDFYSGIIYRALGIPTDMFTVMFALGRLPGWIAQWKEMTQRGEPIGRPRQIYIGETERNYVPISAR
jgi:citrate synthase